MGRSQQSLAISNWRRQAGIVLANSSLKFRWCSCCRPLLEDSTGGFVEAYDAMLLTYEDALECPSTDIFVSLRGWRPNHPLSAYSVVRLDDEEAVYLRFHACGEKPVQGHVGVSQERELARLDGNGKPVVATVPAPRCGWKNFRLTDGQQAAEDSMEAVQTALFEI